jgi:glutamate synthase domain-containing protein 2
MPLKESLPLVVDLLHSCGLRQRIHVIASGKLLTPGKLAWALATGADVVTSARGFMFALGCIQALQFNKNTCPTGITTHRKAERVTHYTEEIERGVALIAHACGAAQPRELTSRRLVRNTSVAFTLINNKQLRAYASGRAMRLSCIRNLITHTGA